VTGGFRSKKAMEEALSSGATDIVGLGRPLTAEPYLIRDLIEGKQEAAKENLVVRFFPFFFPSTSSTLSLPLVLSRLSLPVCTDSSASLVAYRPSNRHRHRSNRCHRSWTAHPGPLHPGGRRLHPRRRSRSGPKGGEARRGSEHGGALREAVEGIKKEKAIKIS
jgi:hypothetical protein